MTKKILLGALVLVMGLALIGCGDDGGSLSVSLLGLKPVTALQPYPGSPVTTVADAEDLLYAAADLIDDDILEDADLAAYNAAFNAKYGMSLVAYMTSLTLDKSASMSVSINDSTSLKDEAAVTAAKITGSHSSSFSSNLTFDELFMSGGDPQANLVNSGDWYKRTMKATRTFEITDGFYTTFGGYNIAGVISMEYNSNESITLKDKTIGKYTGSQDSVSKVSVALTVYNASYGAKFSFSVANMSNDKAKSVTGGEASSYSDIEVYDNAGAKIMTLPAEKYYFDSSSIFWAWEDLPEDITNNPFSP